MSRIDVENFYILYGSETGNAKNYSRMLWNKLRDFNFNVKLSTLDDFKFKDLHSLNLTIVFIVSTTGQGEPPSNMTNFWKFILKKSLNSLTLNNLHFAILGLGDSKYLKFWFLLFLLNLDLIIVLKFFLKG